MSEWLWIIAIFGTLLALEEQGHLCLFSKAHGVYGFLRKNFRIGWQSLYLLLFYYGLSFWLTETMAFSFMLLFPLAFLLAYSGKNSKILPFTTFSVSYYALSTSHDQILLAAFLTLHITFCIFLFQIFLIGFLEKAQLAKIPEDLKGPPVWFLSAAFLSLAFFWLNYGIRG